jgi:probable F420-dependent oxidoreductase
MDFGASIFFTEYSIPPAELAVALEERGCDSLWVAEHSHIPVARRFNAPTGGELERQYDDVMDPFVTLSAAAAATTRLKLATGVCLVIQRDTIQTAKLVASLDQVSGGRFIFGIGGGWNAEEMENHGTAYETRFKKLREQIEAMKVIWTKAKSEYHGQVVDFTPMMTEPGQATSADHRRWRLPLRRGARSAMATSSQRLNAGSGEPKAWHFRRWRERLAAIPSLYR